MTLFKHHADNKLKRYAPLAARMRPSSFDEFLGQEHVIGPGRVLRNSINADQIPSMVLWGPAGSGKTTLALLIASVTGCHFEKLSAVESGVTDLRRIAHEAQERLGMHNLRTILFVDEIHRFNKSQQDVILPHVENGTLIMIGATTENPSFEVISPLLSRARVFKLTPLSDTEIRKLILRAIDDSDRGLGKLAPQLDDEAMNTLITLSNGDARNALNALELATQAIEPNEDGVRRLTQITIEDAMQQRFHNWDKSGDQHYDTISAFIKSIRGSDPDAAIYWLARMIKAGEDPMFIARRLVILAAEDIGMADPQALSIATATQQGVHFVGMPEGAIVLAEATIYLATSIKSNSSYKALKEATLDVENTRNESVPLHLRNAVTDLMKDMGYGEGYKYSHNYEGNFAKMDNLPSNLRGKRYYTPSDQGYEADVGKNLLRWWGERKKNR